MSSVSLVFINFICMNNWPRADSRKCVLWHGTTQKLGLSVLWTINPVSVSGSLDPLASRPCSPAGGSATLSSESLTDSVYLQNGV